MSKKYCDYQGCKNVRNTHGNITFFSLPNDERRAIWIENSGNEALKSMNNKTVRFICEEHFERKYLRHQFSRSTLSRAAVPIRYSSKLESYVKVKESPTLLDSNNLKNNFNIVLKSDIKETVISDENSKNYVEYDIEYYGNDTNSNTSQKSNSIEIDPSDKDELLENPNSALICENDDSNMFDGINQTETFEYFEDQEEVIDKPVLLRVKRNLDQNKYSAPLKKIKKYPGPNEVQSCSSDEITSSTIETIRNKIENRPFIVLKNKPLDITLKKNLLHNLKKMDCPKQLESQTKFKEVKTTIRKEDYEEDMHFALSLVGNFQRLPLPKKALAKVKILQYLTNLEFSDSELSNI